jgi:hypothetical protein
VPIIAAVATAAQHHHPSSPRVPRPQDFLINLGKTNPLDYKFYGVCTSRCPASLDVV